MRKRVLKTKITSIGNWSTAVNFYFTAAHIIFALSCILNMKWTCWSSPASPTRPWACLRQRGKRGVCPGTGTPILRMCHCCDCDVPPWNATHLELGGWTRQECWWLVRQGQREESACTWWRPRREGTGPGTQWVHFSLCYGVYCTCKNR